MSSTQPKIKYTQKRNAFSPATTWEIEGWKVYWHDETGASGHIHARDIKKVRFRHEPSRSETRRVGLHFYTSSAHTITNIHYAGLMNFKEKSEDFLHFVTAFHAMFSVDSKTVFHQGSSWGAYLFNLLITGFVLLLLLAFAPLIALTGSVGVPSIFRIVMIVIFLPLLLRLLIQNRPKRYQSDQWPRHMLS